MDLSKIAGYFDDTEIDVLRSSDRVWQKSKLKGQLKLADDFISIFNRPTRRRMLTVSPEAYKLLNGAVIRTPASGEVYLIGNPQQDIGKGGVYRVTLPLNKAVDRVEVFRKDLPGIGDDVGALVNNSLGHYYTDLELRTLTIEGETLNSAVSKYFFWFANDADIQADDEFYLNGTKYRILEVYPDTGFLGARATNEQDSREVLLYRQLTGDALYDNETGEYTKSYNEYAFSAEVKEITRSREEQGQQFEDREFTVLIESGHLGVTPRLKDMVVIDEVERRIANVVRHRHSDSWELLCR